MTVASPRLHPQPREWRAVRTDADPLSLVVVYLGGMDQLGPDQVAVEESNDEVVVRLTSSGRSGYLGGVLRHVRVRLRAPLGGRRVLDPARGIRHEVFDGRLLHELIPPAGYRPAWEEAPDGSPWEVQAPTTWCLTTMSADGRGPRVSLCHSTDTAEPVRVDADWVVVGYLPNDATVAVRRHLKHPGLTATWLDPASGHRLTLSSSGMSQFSADDPLLHVARAL